MSKKRTVVGPGEKSSLQIETEEMRKHIAELHEAAQNAIDNWEKGDLAGALNRLAKLFDDSNRAASWLGPKMRNPAFSNKSTIPAARTSSGPTTVRSIDSRCAKLSN